MTREQRLEAALRKIAAFDRNPIDTARAALSEEEGTPAAKVDPPFDMSLHGNPDAAAWAREFVRLHGGDEGLMLGWFANAMCAQMDFDARRRSPSPATPSEAPECPHPLPHYLFPPGTQYAGRTQCEACGALIGGSGRATPRGDR